MPTWIAKRFPLVVITAKNNSLNYFNSLSLKFHNNLPLVATNVKHGIDGATSTEHLTSGI
jgi:hypothetical protein